MMQDNLPDKGESRGIDFVSWLSYSYICEHFSPLSVCLSACNAQAGTSNAVASERAIFQGSPLPYTTIRRYHAHT
jgi:hypothetical protein